MIKIDKGIPVPPPGRGTGKGGGPDKYPWQQMEIGDSFYVPWITTNAMRSSIDFQQRRHPGRKYTVRLWDDGVRVWRTR